MRYEDMARLYPQVIEDLFDNVAGQVGAGQPPAAVMSFMALRVDKEIHRTHRRAVLEKLTRWAEVVESDNKGILSDHPEAYARRVKPDACAHCGSIDVLGGICRWCHTEVV